MFSLSAVLSPQCNNNFPKQTLTLIIPTNQKMDNQSKIETGIKDILLLLDQIKNKDPKIAVRQLDYVRSTLTRILNQHFDYLEMKDFLFGNSFESTVLEAAKMHCPMMLTPRYVKLHCPALFILSYILYMLIHAYY